MAYLLSATVTDHLRELRAIVVDMLTSHRADLTPRVQAIVRTNSLTERIRFGEFARFDAEYEQTWQLATDVLHSTELRGQLRFVQACRYISAGDVERGVAVAELGYQDLQDLQGVSAVWKEPTRFVLDCWLMLRDGTLAGHAEQLAARLAKPDHPSIPHLAAPAAALGFAQGGDTRRARQIVSRWFAPPPRSWTWIQAICYWTQVAIAVGVPDPGWLYDQLEPHAGELAIVGVGLDCGGAVDSLLAGSPGASAAPARPPDGPGPAWRWRPASAPGHGSPGPKDLIDQINAAPEAPTEHHRDRPTPRPHQTDQPPRRSYPRARILACTGQAATHLTATGNPLCTAAPEGGSYP